jgi:formate hydrogenlyase subunit 4
LQGRQGPSPFQPYWDIWKYFHRRGVVPETASWIFSAAPFIIFGCYLLIASLVPVVYLPSRNPLVDPAGGPPLADFLVIVFLVGLAQFTLALAGMDSGSPYGGMGSSREMFMHILAEPVLILIAYALALNARTTSLSGTMVLPDATGHIENQSGVQMILLALLDTFTRFSDPLLILIGLALVLVMLAEAGRMPFDNPASHLELTMVSKAVQLEYSGYNLALIEWAEALRLTFFMTLLVNLFLPRWLITINTPFWLAVILLLLYPLKLWGVVTGLALWEETRARMRLRGLVTPGVLALVFAIFAIFMAAIKRYFSL